MKLAPIFLRLAGLTIALVVVVGAMRGLTPESIQKTFRALGIEPSAPGQPGFSAVGIVPSAGEKRKMLCRTRIRAIRFADGLTVREVSKGMKLDWIAEAASLSSGGSARSLGYLEMEKWLSQHCQFVAKELRPPEPRAAGAASGTAGPATTSATLAASVTFEFVDGSLWGLARNGARFQPVAGAGLGADSAEPPFLSADLDQALADLRLLAGFPVDSKTP